MKKRALTLLEIMIVIFLITLITGTIGYSMKGTLEKGRAFRTEQGLEQLHDLLLIALADGAVPEEVAKSPETALKGLGLAKDPAKLVLDGWNERFEIKLSPARNDFSIRSLAYQRYKNRMKPKEGDSSDAEEEN